LSSTARGGGGDEGISPSGDGGFFADGGGAAASAGGGGVGVGAGASSLTEAELRRPQEALAAGLARARRGGGGGKGVAALRGVCKTRRFFGGTSADGSGSHGDGEGGAAAAGGAERVIKSWLHGGDAFTGEARPKSDEACLNHLLN
jgi:hypothetical protein